MKLFRKVLAALLVISVLAGCFAFSALAEGEDNAQTDAPAMFWLTHYNVANVEGAGVVYTENDLGGAWWHHIAFKPVEGKANVYEVSDVVFGTNGEAVAITVPEGGFVYACNTGNDWPTLCEGLTGDGTGPWYNDPEHLAMPNYVSAGSSSAWDWAGALTVGEKYVFTGIDLSGLAVPTATPDKEWYEPDYVCTSTIKAYVEGEDDNTNNDGDDNTTEPDPEPQPDTGIEADLIAAVGEKDANAQFDVVLSAEGSYKAAGDKFTVNATVKNVTHESGLATVEFEFRYDASKVKLTNAVNSDNSLDCIVKLPGTKWENIVKASDDEAGLINASVIVAEADTMCVNDGDITLAFEFEVLEGAEGEIGFYVTTSNIGATDWDNPTSNITGNGSYAIIGEASEDTTTEPDETSEETESSKDSDDNGDATVIIVLVALALVAALGCGVVIKARK